MFNRFKGVNEKVKKTKIHNDMLIISLSSMSTTVTNIIKVGLIIVGVFYALQKRIDVGAVTALFVLSSSFYNPVMSLCYEIGDIMGTKAIVNKIGEILNYNVPKEKMFVEKVKCIRLENISFSYNDNKQALENIDLSFEAGKKYLIIGESGSGKTTLFRLLLKMNTGYIGNIYINGDEYRNISEESIYKIIGYAKQDTYIFNGTLKENIDINGTNDREKMTECIQKCRLEKFMANLPNGLETNIGEEINKISEGEKMRICLARALYKECDVLLLDEITASLDPINSKEVEKVITSITDKIVINICHKYDEDTLKTYDKIVVLDGGRIVNVGTYEEQRNRKVLE